MRELKPVLVAATIAAGVVGMGQTAPPTAAFPVVVAAKCGGTPIVALSSLASAIEELGVDITLSTGSKVTRGLYRAAAVAVVDRAAMEHAALRIVAFGASGVGTRLMFEGSFAPVGADEVFNLAAVNRERCLAYAAVDAIVRMKSPSGGGSGVAGTLASLIVDARSHVRSGGTATVQLITDGCEAPSSRGPNRALTDLCGKLAHRMSAESVLRAHPDEFGVGDARGVSVVMEGVGIGRDPGAANSVFAARLAGFWRIVCTLARSQACRIGSSLS